MSQNQSTNRRANAGRIVTSLGVALLVIAVAIAAYLFGLGFFRTPEATPTIVAMAPTLPPTAVAPTNTHTPTSTATWTPTSTSTLTSTPSPTPELGTSNIYVEYILDASGSMNEKLPGGGIKLAVAKDLLTENLQAFLPETNVGLRAYGHRVYYQQTAKSCQDIELIAPVDKGQMESIATWLQDFKAQGMTPLAESIRQAMDDFVFDPAHINSIVMLSDGIETCGGDPCGLVEELKAQGIEFTIHVIGLQVDAPTRQQLQCIAQAGGGTYHDADSEQDLAEALGTVQEDVTEEEVVVPPGVDTPTPAPPTPTDTPIPPTVTDTPKPKPTKTRVSPTKTVAPNVGEGEVLFRGIIAVGGGVAWTCFSSPCPGEGNVQADAPQAYQRVAVTEAIAGGARVGTEVFVQWRRDGICAGSGLGTELWRLQGTPVEVYGRWTEWPEPVHLPPDISGNVEICTSSKYYMRANP